MKRINVIINENSITNLNEIILKEQQQITGEIDPISTSKKISNNNINNDDDNSMESKVTVSGYVLDKSNHPIPNGKISIISPKSSSYKMTFTDRMGTYKLKNIPYGDVILKAEAPGHYSTTQLIHVGSIPINNDIRVVFRLEIDEHIIGLPRLLFIIATGCLLVLLVVCCTFCIQFLQARARKGNKPYYSFSILPQKEKLFANDDAEDELDETELFRSPIKKGVNVEPYYDDEREPIVETTDDDSQDDIVMLDRRNFCDE